MTATATKQPETSDFVVERRIAVHVAVAVKDNVNDDAYDNGSVRKETSTGAGTLTIRCIPGC